MGWRIVKQPNGLLGRFSDVVDDFTHIDMTQDEAIDACLNHLGRHDAALKVQRGIDDEPIPPFIEASGKNDGLDRWRAAIETVAAIHGRKIANQRVRECSRPIPCPGRDGSDGGGMRKD